MMLDNRRLLEYRTRQVKSGIILELQEVPKLPYKGEPLKETPLGFTGSDTNR